MEGYIPASEKYTCLKECKKVAWCFKCDKENYKSEEKQKEHTDDTDFEEKDTETDGYKPVIEVCALRRVHEHKDIWVPKLGQKLIVKRIKSNAFMIFRL